MKPCACCEKELIQRYNESPARFESRIVCDRACYNGWRAMRAASKKVAKAADTIRRGSLWASDAWAGYNAQVRKNAS